VGSLPLVLDATAILVPKCQGLRKSSGSLAMFIAIRRARSFSVHENSNYP
jgi:hypothetical protein